MKPQTDSDDLFPALTIFPDFRDCTGQLLEVRETLTKKLDVMGGEMIYKLSINK